MTFGAPLLSWILASCSYRYQVLGFINDYMLFSALNLLVCRQILPNRIYMMWSLNTSWVYDANVGALFATDWMRTIEWKFIRSSSMMSSFSTCCNGSIRSTDKVTRIMRYLTDCFERYKIAFMMFWERIVFLSCPVYNFFYNFCHCLSVRLVEYCSITLIDWYS